MSKDSKGLRNYFYNILVALDILCNTVAGGKVRTISARIGDKKVSGTMDPLTASIDWFLEKLDPGHSVNSYRAWEHYTDRSGREYHMQRMEDGLG